MTRSASSIELAAGFAALALVAVRHGCGHADESAELYGLDDVARFLCLGGSFGDAGTRPAVAGFTAKVAIEAFAWDVMHGRGGVGFVVSV